MVKLLRGLYLLTCTDCNMTKLYARKTYMMKESGQSACDLCYRPLLNNLSNLLMASYVYICNIRTVHRHESSTTEGENRCHIIKLSLSNNSDIEALEIRTASRVVV